MREFDWEVRSLLNKQDPIGMMQQKPPHIFVISDDFGRQKDLGILRAAQRFRESGMKIIALYQDGDPARENAALCDASLSPPWKTVEMRENLIKLFRDLTGQSPPECESDDEADD